MSAVYDKLLAFLEARLRSAALEIAGPGGRLDRVGPADASLAGTIEFDRPNLIPRLMANPGLWVGDSYAEGEWRVIHGDLAQIIAALRKDIEPAATSWLPQFGYAAYVVRHLVGQFAPKFASARNVQHHYDIGNAFYDLWLDENLFYSCAYFHDPGESLETAQRNKARHIAAKLNLAPGDHVLDIGCGWGGMAFYLARHCDVQVTGISLAAEQIRHATERAAALGLSARTQFKLCDYRDIGGHFDAIVSIGMLEHVGRLQLTRYFSAVHDLLHPDGVALIHSIGTVGGGYVTNQWIDRHIFPGGYIPSLRQIAAAIEKTPFIVCDVETLRNHYALTLRAWRRRLHAARNAIVGMFDARFFRIWDFYLALSEASFLAGVNVNYQIQCARDIDILPVTRDYLYAPEFEDGLVADDRMAAGRLAAIGSVS